MTYNVSSPPSKSWKSLVKKKNQTLRREKEYHSVWIRKTSLVKATGTGGQISRVKQYLSYIKLKKRFTVIYASTSLDTKTDLQSPRIVILKADRRFVVLLLSTFSGFSILPRVFPLPLATLLVIVSSSSLHWANKKKVSAMGYFSREYWYIVIDAIKALCPIGLQFREAKKSPGAGCLRTFMS